MVSTFYFLETRYLDFAHDAYKVHEPAAQDSTRYELQPLDPPPPVKSGWPTPWINKNDFEKYLGPLYHRGWGVRYLYPRQKGERTSAELFANYKFATFTAATNFIHAVGQIAVSEKVSSLFDFDDSPESMLMGVLTLAPSPTAGCIVQENSRGRPLHSNTLGSPQWTSGASDGRASYGRASWDYSQGRPSRHPRRQAVRGRVCRKSAWVSKPCALD